MKKLFYILPLAAMLFAACDKIEMNADGIYGSVAGAAATWQDGNGVSDKAQRAFLEKYTGARCVNCPNADSLINVHLASYPGKMIAVAVESHTSFGNNYNGSPNLRCEDGIIWSEYYGAEQLPACLVNRIDERPFIAMADIKTKVDNVIAQNTKVAIAITNKQVENNAQITVDLEFLENVSDQLVLTILVMEDSIVAKQLSTNGLLPEYVHNHVLRDVVTDAWGTDIDATGTAGEKRCGTFQYTINEEWNKHHCKLVAFVSNKSNKQIINAAECELINE